MPGTIRRPCLERAVSWSPRRMEHGLNPAEQVGPVDSARATADREWGRSTNSAPIAPCSHTPRLKTCPRLPDGMWRVGSDSNAGAGSSPTICFRDSPLRPLRHLPIKIAEGMSQPWGLYTRLPRRPRAGLSSSAACSPGVLPRTFAASSDYSQCGGSCPIRTGGQTCVQQSVSNRSP